MTLEEVNQCQIISALTDLTKEALPSSFLIEAFYVSHFCLVLRHFPTGTGPLDFVDFLVLALLPLHFQANLEHLICVSWKPSSLFQMKHEARSYWNFPPPSANAFLISGMNFLSITSTYLHKFIIPSIDISEATPEKLKLPQPRKSSFCRPSLSSWNR